MHETHDSRHWRTFSRLALVFCLAFLLAGNCALAETSRGSGDSLMGDNLLRWGELPPLPDSEGFAGAFAGASNGALLVGGGANFPDGRPWEGGQKVWHDKIFVLERLQGEWIAAEQKLPRPIAYGVSASYGNRVICVGGEDGAECYAHCFALAWNGQTRRVEISDLPPLPRPVAFACGAVVGNTLYVAGGIGHPQATRALKTFYALRLDVPDSELQWRELPAWPGPERMQPVAGSQDGSFYIMSGIQLQAADDGAPERVTPYLADAYRYQPPRDGRDEAPGAWRRIADVPRPVAAAPSPAFTVGRWHLAVMGGADSTLNHLPPQEHPGFKNDVHFYHVPSDRWLRGADMPAGSARVTTPTAFWQGRHLIISGERAPGVRSPNVYEWEFAQPSFGWLNWISLVVYIVLMLGMGVYYSGRNHTTNDFFLAGQRIPWWAAGLSIYGTQLSAITFMTIPAIAFADNWTRMIGNLLIVLVAPLVVYCYLPLFRRLNAASAYQYLELRFNAAVRMLASAVFMIFHLARMGIVLCLPAIALSAVTGIDVYVSILIMGVVCTIYTVMGGIEAVIWTDVIQVIIFLAGALLCLAVAMVGVGSWSALWTTAVEFDKLKMFQWGWSWSEKNFWVVAVGMFVLSMIPYTSDQTIIQRYLTTKDERAAARGVWMNAWMAIPTAFLFFGMGTALFIFYYSHPTLAVPAETDRIVPWFIMHHLPPAMAGLVVAAIFAAAMSTLDSSMNSMVTAYISDFHRRFWPQASDNHCLILARWLTFLLGALGTGMAMWIAAANIESLFDHFQKILGMLGGSLAGIFVLGIFSRRANARGALIGAVAGATAPFLAQTFTTIDPFLYGAVGLASCIAVGLAASPFLAREPQDLTGLTVYTIGSRRA